MNKEYLREWYFAKVEEYKARAKEAESFERKEYYLNEVEHYKKQAEKLKD